MAKSFAGPRGGSLEPPGGERLARLVKCELREAKQAEEEMEEEEEMEGEEEEEEEEEEVAEKEEGVPWAIIIAGIVKLTGSGG